MIIDRACYSSCFWPMMLKKTHAKVPATRTPFDWNRYNDNQHEANPHKSREWELDLDIATPAATRYVLLWSSWHTYRNSKQIERTIVFRKLGDCRHTSLTTVSNLRSAFDIKSRLIETYGTEYMYVRSTLLRSQEYVC